MDKKTKFSQSSAKAAASDGKKTQELVNNKLFPKTSRKREPSSTSAFPKYDQGRKNNVQKAKNFDKRPKPKGQYHGGAKEDTKVVQEESAELGSVMVQGSKKQNLNHLLNFYYEPRDVQNSSNAWGHGKASGYSNRNSNRWLPPIQRHKYNKEQFLQASCQFIVTANHDYSLYLSDPDVLVDWKLIQQVKLYSPEGLSCPICLYPPVAGKMTRCGHVYCWPCILHYLSLSDKTWRKCPICYESVHKSDLKSVLEIRQTALNIGDKVSLHLMCREKGSLLAVPVTEAPVVFPTTFSSVSENTDNQVYSKLLIASNAYVMNIIENERVQLNIELTDNPDSAENCYIEEALGELKKREQELFEKMTNEAVSALKDRPSEMICMLDTEEREGIARANPCESNKDDEDEGTAASSSSERYVETTNTGLNDIQGSSSSQKLFYFYQAQDGQHVYLHAMNVKMLEMQYGSLKDCPRVITGKLLEKESGSFTEELRRRLRYLCHLPLTCQFEIAEIELQSPIVSEQVLNSFREQLELREKRRRRRARDEKNREKKIIEEENKRMGRYPTPNVNIESHRHFPQWQPELMAEDSPSSPESMATSVASSPSLSTFDDIASTMPEVGQCLNEPGPSFAEMLRNSGVRYKSNAWPSIGSNSTYGSGTRLRATEIDECTSVPPPYSQSFGDALAQALEQTKLSDSGVKAEPDTSGAKRKKKKKSKPTVLFATSMASAP